MRFKPTAEQQDIIGKVTSGKSIKITAYAGAGKTSTLVQCAAAVPDRRGVYLAFNAEAKKDAEKKFKGLNVRVFTTHGLAYCWFRDTHPNINPSSGIYRGFEIANLFSLVGLQKEQTKFTSAISAPALGAAIADCIIRFCSSGDSEIEMHHFNPNSIRAIPERFSFADSKDPRKIPEINKAKRELLAPYLRIARDLKNMIFRSPDRHPIGHDVYLKMWSLTAPMIDCDYLMLDEAQDTNGAVIAALNANANLQKIIVGDSYQQIYAFRGATNAMQKMHVEHTGVLSKSFRYGESIGELASNFLRMVRGADVRVRGFDAVNSEIDIGEPDFARLDCIIARTNTGAIEAGLMLSEKGCRVKLSTGSTGKAEWISKLTAVSELLSHGKTEAHADYVGFDYGSFLSHLESAQGAQDKSLRNIIEKYGIDAVSELLEQGARLRKDVTHVMTAHGSKGLEFDRVLIWGDFPQEVAKYDGEEGNLLYVALTRAKTWLGIGLCPVLVLANKLASVSGDVQPTVVGAVTTRNDSAGGLVDDSDARRISMGCSVSQYVVAGEVTDAEAKASGMVRCPECSQRKCPTPTVIRLFPRLRWCGSYTAGAKPVWDRNKKDFVYDS